MNSPSFSGSLRATIVAKWAAVSSCLIMVLSSCAAIRTAASRGSAPTSANATNGVSEYAHVMPIAKEQPRDVTGQVLLAYQMIGASPDTQCRLRIVGEASVDASVSPLTSRGDLSSQAAASNEKEVFLEFSATQTAASVELPSGHYHFQRMGCGIARVWEMDDLYSRDFVVESDRTSYLGQLIFKFENDDLVEVIKAGRFASARALTELGSRAVASQNLNQKMIAAFTHEPLTFEIANDVVNELSQRQSPQPGVASFGFVVHASGIDAAGTSSHVETDLAPLLARLRRCDAENGKNDPLKLGVFSTVGVYQNGSFQDFKTTVESGRAPSSALAPEFRSCVNDSLVHFQPNRDIREISVQY
jgi:hypothetical protein